MRTIAGARRSLLVFLLSSALPVSVLAGDTLSTNGFSTCLADPQIQVSKLNILYNRNTRVLTFDVAGSSTEPQNVTLDLTVTAYGQNVYDRSFSPCDYSGLSQLCPVPSGEFSGTGQQTIPEEYASKIPSIAFSVPDLDGDAKMQVKTSEGMEIGCISSSVGNGRTFQSPAVSWVAGGVVAAAFAASAVSALLSGGSPGATGPSPSFGETLGWFQGMAINGMMSVNYPTAYRSFASNFGFSTGLIPWAGMQKGIDTFRQHTGGNLTNDSYQYLQSVTLVYPDGTTASNSTGLGLTRRWLESALLYARDGSTLNVNGTSTSVGGNGGNTSESTSSSKPLHEVKDLQAYVEQLTIPQANTFMTLLLVFAIVIAAIVVLILLGKVILEFWAMFGKLPKSLESWRNRYWWRMAKAIVNLILLLYGVWTIYCIYQFTNGDSWAAKLLAGITMAVFTGVLAFFTWKIWYMARQARRNEGDTSKLYEDKETWIKYSLFYDSYKQGYWWVFVPAIIYMLAKGCVIAGANGHGLVQSGGQLIIEAVMLAFLLWCRPYHRRSGQWINLSIHVVRVLSVVCVLIFVEELGISQTTKTITGLILIIVQAVMTGLLAILIAVNAIITCVRENPHRRKRKQAEKDAAKDLDALTTLDARNSLLLAVGPAPHYERTEYSNAAAFPLVATMPADRKGRYDPVPAYRSPSPPRRFDRNNDCFHRNESQRDLVSGAASMGTHSRTHSREPRIPSIDIDDRSR